MENRKKNTAECRDTESSMRASVLWNLKVISRPLGHFNPTIPTCARVNLRSPTAASFPRRYFGNLTPSQAGLRFVRRAIWPEAETEEVEAVRSEIWEGQNGGMLVTPVSPFAVTN